VASVDFHEWAAKLDVTKELERLLSSEIKPKNT
jgi:hypothetical protein